MWESVMNAMSGAGSSIGNMWNSASNPLANAWDSASAPSDDLLAQLADEEEYRFKNGITEASPEHTKAWEAVKNAPNAAEKIGKAMQAAQGLGGQGGQQMQHRMGGQGGKGTNIQTEDQYAAAMKALVDKYGQFMFNKNF